MPKPPTKKIRVASNQNRTGERKGRGILFNPHYFELWKFLLSPLVNQATTKEMLFWGRIKYGTLLKIRKQLIAEKILFKQFRTSGNFSVNKEKLKGYVQNNFLVWWEREKSFIKNFPTRNKIIKEVNEELAEVDMWDKYGTALDDYGNDYLESITDEQKKELLRQLSVNPRGKLTKEHLKIKSSLDEDKRPKLNNFWNSYYVAIGNIMDDEEEYDRLLKQHKLDFDYLFSRMIDEGYFSFWRHGGQFTKTKEDKVSVLELEEQAYLSWFLPKKTRRH